MADILCLVACRNFEQEVAAVLGPGDQPDVQVFLVPAVCSRSCALWDDPSAHAPSGMSGCTDVLVLAGRPPQAVTSPLHGENVRYLGPAGECHCLLAPSSLLEEHQRKASYLVTPGWLRDWRSHVGRWGFDHEGLKAFFHESMKSIVLLDTLTNAQSEELLHEFGQYTELPVSRIPIGLDYFRLVLNGAIAEWRTERSRRRTIESLSDANKRSAEYAMALDLLYSLAGSMDAGEVAEKLLELFSALFAPERSGVSISQRGQPPRLWSRPPGKGSPPEPAEEEYAMLPGGRGFSLRLGYRGEPLGVVWVDGIQFPEYRDRYLKTATAIVKVCGLALSNASTYQQLESTVRELRAALARVKTLHGLLPICSSCKRIRDDAGYWHQVEAYLRENTDAGFTHGLCPDCLRELYPELAEKILRKKALRDRLKQEEQKRPEDPGPNK
jgi:hypothetical protein